MIPNVQRILEEGIARGLHTGAVLYASVGGRSILDLALGSARSDMLFCWQSATKPVGAVALGQLFERGALRFDDPVSRYIPEFAAHSKEGITIQHLLTHTSGVPNMNLEVTALPRAEIIDRICGAHLTVGWVPGEKAAYNYRTTWQLVGELVRRIDGRDYSRYVREETFAPAGMKDSWIGMPRGQYEKYNSRIGVLLNSFKPPATPQPWDNAANATACLPGHGGYGPVGELGRFYEALLAGKLVKPATLELLTSRHRTGMFDHTFQHVMDWGLGFIVESSRYGIETVPYGFGRHASERTFGHGGAQSSMAFADPDRQLVVAWVCDGMPGEPRHHRRNLAINTAIYEDLGFSLDNPRI